MINIRKVILSKEQAEVLEKLRTGFSKRVIFYNYKELDSRLSTLEQWEIAQALLTGYEVGTKVMVLSY